MLRWQLSSISPLRAKRRRSGRGRSQAVDGAPRDRGHLLPGFGRESYSAHGELRIGDRCRTESGLSAKPTEPTGCSRPGLIALPSTLLDEICRLWPISRRLQLLASVAFFHKPRRWINSGAISVTALMRHASRRPGVGRFLLRTSSTLASPGRTRCIPNAVVSWKDFALTSTSSALTDLCSISSTLCSTWRFTPAGKLGATL